MADNIMNARIRVLAQRLSVEEHADEEFGDGETHILVERELLKALFARIRVFSNALDAAADCCDDKAIYVDENGADVSARTFFLTNAEQCEEVPCLKF